MEVSF